MPKSLHWTLLCYPLRHSAKVRVWGVWLLKEEGAYLPTGPGLKKHTCAKLSASGG